ncbi:TPA: SDR family oxidoreductase [Vibrio parahaemolyticus]|uniref:SDR family NAD(P)-dependent oxidoreductase n=1 Tax=Vibrio parahaemolyticus TaxID=670 RepID=UPI001D16F93B|nr:SDR family oxidoreductase [Vibrio parahaemolyticus]MCC3780837.1 SDR family oxidoreductase [Vibrio parahaemolyticus]
MNSLIIIGSSSTISRELELNLRENFRITMAGRGENKFFDANEISNESIEKLFDKKYDKYIFNIGLIYPKRILNQTTDEITSSVNVNLLFIVKACEYILETNPNASIFIIGSESGKKGSFDTTYFLTKAALRAYVKERAISHPNQSIVLFSPSTIVDAGMTTRRQDKNRLDEYQREHPKQRFLTSQEVSRCISAFLSDEFSYISNTEIEINGGKFSRMKY